MMLISNGICQYKRKYAHPEYALDHGPAFWIFSQDSQIRLKRLSILLNGPLNSDISKVGRNAKYAAELYSSFISNFNNESEKLTIISVKVDRFLGFELIIR